MLFGALFSAYILLRVGAPEWPHGELSIKLGAINTVILISSSVTMVMAWASLKMHDWGKHRLYLSLTFLLAAVFLVNKYFEYREHFDAGQGPWHSTFLAIYFTLTGLHGLHVIGGMVVMLYLLGPGAKMWKTQPGAVHQPDRDDGTLLALRRPGLDLPVPGAVPAVVRLKPDTTKTVRSVRLQADVEKRMSSDAADVKKSVRSYLIVFGALLVGTALTVAANEMHLVVPLAITVALIIAVVKGSMVAGVFMHLSHEKKAIYAALLLTVVFFIVLLFVPMLTMADHIGTPIGMAR